MLKRAIILLTFVSIFLVNIRPIEIGDFWWHIRSGQWIYEHQSLPEKDPFSYTTPDDPSDEKKSILRSYWLSQLLMYLLYDSFDFNGVVVGRALFFTSIFILLFLILRYYRLDWRVSLLMVLSIVPAMTVYIEARPQAVSFFMAVLVFFILERLRGEEEGKPSLRLLVLLPFSMLLWSNMHGGFVIGIGIIAVYTALEIIKTVRRGIERRRYAVIASCLISIAVTYLNPEGINAIKLALTLGSGAMASTSAINEYFSPQKYYEDSGKWRYFYSLCILFTAALISFILRRKKVNAFHLILAGIFSYAALTTFRYGAFFFPFGVIFVGYNMSERFKDERIKIRLPLAAIPVLAAAAILFMEKPAIEMGVGGAAIPEGAVQYIKNAHPSRELFAPYEWGGYAMWTFYPDYRTFIDGRAMDEDVFKEYQSVQNAKPSAGAILDKYNVNTVLLFTERPNDHMIYEMMYYLLHQIAWEPVYWDAGSVIFVRKPFAGRTDGKRAVWNILTGIAKYRVEENPSDANALSTLGEVYFQQGLMGVARKYFIKALSFDGNNDVAKAYLEVIDKMDGGGSPP